MSESPQMYLNYNKIINIIIYGLKLKYVDTSKLELQMFIKINCV